MHIFLVQIKLNSFVLAVVNSLAIKCTRKQPSPSIQYQPSLKSSLIDPKWPNLMKCFFSPPCLCLTPQPSLCLAIPVEDHPHLTSGQEMVKS